VIDAQSSKDKVHVELSNGDRIYANVLIGADGINSNVRNIIMR
jgi:2-polyprenyl-6-methoxyphenol hydroxylase-like FAD-dependent oxidoreductase